jgi:hypothetical protein
MDSTFKSKRTTSAIFSSAHCSSPPWSDLPHNPVRFSHDCLFTTSSIQHLHESPVTSSKVRALELAILLMTATYQSLQLLESTMHRGCMVDISWCLSWLSEKRVSSSHALEGNGAGEARLVNHTSAVRNEPTAPLERKYFQRHSGELGGNEQGQRWMRYHMSKLANSTFTFALQVCVFVMVAL